MQITCCRLTLVLVFLFHLLKSESSLNTQQGDLRLQPLLNAVWGSILSPVKIYTLIFHSSCHIPAAVKFKKKKRAQGQYVGPCDNARSVNKQKNKTSAQQTSNRSGQGGDCICFHLCGQNTAKFFQLAIIIYIIIYIIS